MSTKPKAKKTSKPVAAVKKAVKAVLHPSKDKELVPLKTPFMSVATEKPWHAPHDLPPDYMTVDVETSGDVVPGRHGDGAWHTLDGKSVGITRWRYR